MPRLAHIPILPATIAMLPDTYRPGMDANQIASDSDLLKGVPKALITSRQPPHCWA